MNNLILSDTSITIADGESVYLFPSATKDGDGNIALAPGKIAVIEVTLASIYQLEVLIWDFLRSSDMEIPDDGVGRRKLIPVASSVQDGDQGVYTPAVDTAVDVHTDKMWPRYRKPANFIDVSVSPAVGPKMTLRYTPFIDCRGGMVVEVRNASGDDFTTGDLSIAVAHLPKHYQGFGNS